MDSNIFFVPAKFRIDIFREMQKLLATKVEPIILLPVLEELKKVYRLGGLKLKKQVSLALEFVKQCKIMDAELLEGESIDDYIVRVAKNLNCIVATNDRNLRKKLRDINIPVIYVREKSHLVVEGVP
jgi:rRNA-processing protein FCF1